MSSYNLWATSTSDVSHPQPLADSDNDTMVIIRPLPVQVTIPGPIMRTFPFRSTVGFSRAPFVAGTQGYGGLGGSGGSSLGDRGLYG
ncbi:KRSC protein, partial [Turnix velox]|nr:KRSC protein [Turnix velox]